MDLTTIQEQLYQHAREQLQSFCERLDYPVEQQLVITGHIESEIHRLSEEQSVDLVIVGSHGRHGLALLLGSTANGVLHGACCDVLAVRIQSDE